MKKTDSNVKEQLPAFKSIEECQAYCKEKQDNFYFTAFMLEAWIGTVIEKAVEHYAERKSGQRHMQTGTGWEAWQFVFGHAAPKEWLQILRSIARFAKCDTGEGEIMNQALILVDTEDKYAEPVLVSTFIGKIDGNKVSTSEMMNRMSFFFRRNAEWLEAIIHWQIHLMATVAPITFQATEERRELANIGVMQAGYADLNEHGKAWWQFRHEELAKQFQGKPEWRLVGKAQSFEKMGALKYPDVDELAIHWWPLLTRYRWTDRDMRGLMRRVVSRPDSYPLREDGEFADYRNKALGLIKDKKERDKSAPCGNPVGSRAALAMVGRLSE